MAVKEKPLEGGGLGPVSGGENHLPAEDKVNFDNIGIHVDVEKAHLILIVQASFIPRHLQEEFLLAPCPLKLLHVPS